MQFKRKAKLPTVIGLTTIKPKGTRDCMQHIGSPADGIPHAFGTPIPRRIYSSWKKFYIWQLAGSQVLMTVCSVLLPCWRTLAQRRADMRLSLFFKIVPLPEYIQLVAKVNLRDCHSFSLRQLHTSRNLYKYSIFPLGTVQGIW